MMLSRSRRTPTPYLISLLTLSVLLFRPAFGQSPRTGIYSEGVPPIPQDLTDAMKRYSVMGATLAEFQGWLAGERQMLYIAEASSGRQVFLATAPGKYRQLTTATRPVLWALASPARGQFVFAVDDGGNENYRLYLHDTATGANHAITSGPSMRDFPRWSRDGRFLGLTTTPAMARMTTSTSSVRLTLRLAANSEPPRASVSLRHGRPTVRKSQLSNNVPTVAGQPCC
jgi:hypothetical protein